MQQTIIPVSLGPFGIVNAFLLHGERTILVDTGFPGSGSAIMAALSRHGIAPKSISLILLTHAHFDHMGSAFEMKERLSAPVAVHESDLQSVRKGVPPPLNPINTWGRILRARMESRTTRPVEPDVVIIRGMNLGEFGIEGKVVETPGHTPGSISILMPGAAVVGDLIAGGAIPGGIIKREHPSHPPFQDDLAVVRSSLQRVLKHKPNKIYVGHGGPLRPHAVQEFIEKDRLFTDLSPLPKVKEQPKKSRS
jgi:glyoxylase-like metal-dependent hydrolase (beta-lactamase superfamily II)